MFAEWVGADRADVTVRDLLEHASGLPARLVDAPPSSRREFEHDICATRLEDLPRTKSVYSHPGVLLLGFLPADLGGAALLLLFRGGRVQPGLQGRPTVPPSGADPVVAAATLPEP